MKYKQLTREQGYAIYLELQEGKSQNAIARQINVHPSTVSREVTRNMNRVNEKCIKNIQYKINRRPREKLKFYSPKRLFFKFIS